MSNSSSFDEYTMISGGFSEPPKEKEPLQKTAGYDIPQNSPGYGANAQSGYPLGESPMYQGGHRFDGPAMHQGGYHFHQNNAGYGTHPQGGYHFGGPAMSQAAYGFPNYSDPRYSVPQKSRGCLKAVLIGILVIVTIGASAIAGIVVTNFVRTDAGNSSFDLKKPILPAFSRASLPSSIKPATSNKSGISSTWTDEKCDVIPEGFARKINPTTSAPIEKVASFNTNDTALYYILKFNRLDRGTTINGKWLYKGEKFLEIAPYTISENLTDNYFNISATLNPGNKFPSGEYQIVISGEKDGNKVFEIKDVINLK
jgi:hypothetical protein